MSFGDVDFDVGIADGFMMELDGEMPNPIYKEVISNTRRLPKRVCAALELLLTDFRVCFEAGGRYGK